MITLKNTGRRKFIVYKTVTSKSVIETEFKLVNGLSEAELVLIVDIVERRNSYIVEVKNEDLSSVYGQCSISASDEDGTVYTEIALVQP